MGMSVQAGKGGRRRRGVPRYGAMADINMTPFIDVMLVLLIIFMVAAPLLSSGVPIDLPSTKAGELNIDKKPIAVAIDEHGDVFADGPENRRRRRWSTASRRRPRRAWTSASMCAPKVRALWPRRGSHVRPYGGGLQEGRARDRSGEEIGARSRLTRR